MVCRKIRLALLVLLFSSLSMAVFSVNSPFFCSSDSQCSDSNPLTLDLCVRPGKFDSGCANLACVPACSSNANCVSDDNSLTGVCAGIGRCTAQCVFVPAATYNNGKCEEFENKCSVPSDCGDCYEKGAGCAEKNCIGDSCKNTIRLGCCGNKICEFKEDFSNCSEDCHPRVLSIELLEDFSSKNFFRGDEIVFKAKILADGVLANGAEFTAEGFFGEIKLFNDGDHNDGTAYDSIFSGKYAVSKEVEKGAYPIELKASFAGTKNSLSKNAFIDPKIELNAVNLPENILLGEFMNLSFRARKGGNPILVPVTVSAKISGTEKEFFREIISSDSEGLASFPYRTSFIEGAGTWVITVSAEDQYGNHGTENFDVNVITPETTAFLKIDLINDLNSSYFRGESIDVNAFVTDELNAPVSNAETFALVFGKRLKLFDSNNGYYSISIPVSFDAFSGINSVKIDSSLNQKGKFFSGSISRDFNIIPVNLNAELVSPGKESVDIGDKIQLVLRLTYPDGSPAKGPPELPVKLNDLNLLLEFSGDGLFKQEYLVTEKDSQGIDIEIDANDFYGNSVKLSSRINVLGMSVIKFIEDNALTIFILCVSFLAVFSFTFYKYFKSKQESRLASRKKEIMDEIVKLQKTYFSEGLMDKENYDRQIFTLETELKEINSLLAESKAKNKGILEFPSKEAKK